TDLAPVLGNGGGADNVRGQHPEPLPGSFAAWKSSFDPLDPDLLWWAGQTGGQRVGVFNIGATDAADIQVAADNAWPTSLFPRGISVTLNDSNERMAYIAMGNGLTRTVMDTTYPHTLSGEELLTAAELDGAVRYAQDVKADDDGNVY